MDKISDKDVKHARQVLDEFIKDSKTCEDSDTLHKKAVACFDRLADSPALIERICQAYNSNKTQYKFASGDDTTRDQDFAILDVRKVASDIANNKLNKTVKKFASDKFSAKFYETSSASKPDMQKAASAEMAAPDPSSYIELDTRDGMAGVTICNVLDHQRDGLVKLAFAVDDAKCECVKAQDPTVREIRKLTKAAAADTLAIASSHYGKLFDAFREFFPKDTPLIKFAGAPMVPDTLVFQKIANSMEKEYVYECKKALLKRASEDVAQTLRKLAGAYNLAKLQKSAALAAPMVGAALAPSLREALRLDDGKKAELYDKLLNQNVQNTLRELETKRNFYEVYADDYISTFPVDDVQVAYNNAIQKLPESLRKHPSSATQLVRSWVTKMLSRGSITSAEDANDVFDAADKLRYEGRARNPYSSLEK